MMDYIRWCFGLDFRTSRYLITREIVEKLKIRWRITREIGEKLKVRWGIRARRYEVKIKGMEISRWVKTCWREKEEGGWKDKYGKEREEYYKINVWGIEAREVKEEGNEDGRLEKDICEREKETQL